ncbi:MAG: GNAT family N-acetyltransferase [Chloroflexi bacterium]|nr:GNAT family N-acetyltransferase [Chloroflexota bacterium]
MTTDTQVITLLDSQRRQAGEVLSRAFFDDPLMEYIFPEEARRERPLTWLMERGARYGLRYGEVHTTAGVEGAAVWLPPGETDMTPLRMMRVGMLIAPFRVGLGAFRRFLAVSDYLEELHKRDVPPQHWYLAILGVDPSRQGQGIGGALIQPIIARSDSAGLPCYLETMKERNVAFYKKHGFVVVVEGDLPDGGPYFWTMKREAGG